MIKRRAKGCEGFVQQELKINLNIKNDYKSMEIKNPCFLLCARHGINLAGESPVTGIYR